jgi:hypothetical protein
VPIEPIAEGFKGGLLDSAMSESKAALGNPVGSDGLSPGLKLKELSFRTDENLKSAPELNDGYSDLVWSLAPNEGAELN